MSKHTNPPVWAEPDAPIERTREPARFLRRALTLAAVLDAAKHAEERVAQWPEWKRAL